MRAAAWPSTAGVVTAPQLVTPNLDSLRHIYNGRALSFKAAYSDIMNQTLQYFRYIASHPLWVVCWHLQFPGCYLP